MNKTYFIAAVSLGGLAAAPAHAQLLGGGGGLLGGQIGGGLSGASGPLRSLPTETLRSSTRGSARGDARTKGSQRVDRRQGSVSIDRSLDGSLDAAGAQVLDTPASSGSAAGSGSGNAAGSGNANAQLIGTDAVREVTGSTAGRARGLATTASERASGLTDSARAMPGSATATASGSGSGSGSGQGSGSVGSGMLAAAGSGAAAGDGAFAIAPGMPVLAPGGAPFGKVRQVVTDSRGRVEGVLVRAKGRDLMIPSADLSGSGEALIMGEGAATTTRDETPKEG